MGSYHDIERPDFTPEFITDLKGDEVLCSAATSPECMAAGRLILRHRRIPGQGNSAPVQGGAGVGECVSSGDVREGSEIAIGFRAL